MLVQTMRPGFDFPPEISPGIDEDILTTAPLPTHLLSTACREEPALLLRPGTAGQVVLQGGVLQPTLAVSSDKNYSGVSSSYLVLQAEIQSVLVAESEDWEVSLGQMVERQTLVASQVWRARPVLLILCWERS